MDHRISGIVAIGWMDHRISGIVAIGWMDHRMQDTFLNACTLLTTHNCILYQPADTVR